MDIERVHRMAALYDASWELVNQYHLGATSEVPSETHSRFVECWGSNAVDQDIETLVHWARNFLRHNARPNV